MHTKAEWLEFELRNLIEASTGKIALLDEIRAREGNKTTKEEKDTSNFFSEISYQELFDLIF